MNLMKGLFGFLFLGTALLLVRPVLAESFKGWIFGALTDLSKGIKKISGMI